MYLVLPFGPAADVKIGTKLYHAGGAADYAVDFAPSTYSLSMRMKGGEDEDGDGDDSDEEPVPAGFDAEAVLAAGGAGGK